MKVLQLIGGIVILFIVFSCSTNYDIFKETLPIGSIKLNYNVQQKVSDNLLLEIIDLNDSRCPVGVVCTQAGSVMVNIRVLANDEIGSLTLHFSELQYANQNVDTILGHRIELLKVNPLPLIDKPILSDSIYSVIVKVEEL